jgi:hypothetical protein
MWSEAFPAPSFLGISFMPARRRRSSREGEWRMDEARGSADPPVSPRQIALTYDRVVSAHWRGETDTAIAFDAWFEAHWSDQAPPEPDAPPEGTSVLGDSGAGIRWYTRDEAVLGYASRRRNGCYRVPMREALPALMASWDILELEAARQPDSDHLLHHRGPSSLPTSPDRGKLSEPDAADQQVSANKSPESTGSETAVAVQVLETAVIENSPGVASSP